MQRSISKIWQQLCDEVISYKLFRLVNYYYREPGSHSGSQFLPLGPSQASTEIFTKFKTYIFDTTDYKTDPIYSQISTVGRIIRIFRTRRFIGDMMYSRRRLITHSTRRIFLATESIINRFEARIMSDILRDHCDLVLNGMKRCHSLH